MFQLRGAEGSYEVKFNNMTLGSRAVLGYNHVSLEEPNGFKKFTFRKMEKGYYTMVVSNGCFYFDRMEVNLNGTVSLNTAFLSRKNDAIFSLILVDNGRPIENPPIQFPQIASKEPLFGKYFNIKCPARNLYITFNGLHSGSKMMAHYQPTTVFLDEYDDDLVMIPCGAEYPIASKGRGNDADITVLRDGD